MDDFEKMSENTDEIEEVSADSTNEQIDEQTGETTCDAACETDMPNPQDDAANDALYEELEGIRDMFQQELDKNSQSDPDTYLASGDMQECDDCDCDTDSENQETEEIPEDMLCECCGERVRDISESDDYPYCAECKQIMRTYPIGVKGIVTLLVVLALGIASLMINFSSNADLLDKAVTAKSAISSGKLYTGLYAYYDAVSTASSSGTVPKKLVANCAKALAALNDYNGATSLANQYLSESDLNSSRFSFIKDYEKKNETITAIENIIYEPLSSADTTADDAQGICDSLEALKNDSEHDYDPFYIDYYEYVVKNTLGVSKEEVYEELLAIDNEYPDEWVHVYDLCDVAAKLGKAEDTEKYYERLKSKNSEEVTAYTCYANLYRFADEVDTDKLLEIVDEGITAQGNFSFAGSAGLYRIKTIAYLLKGDNEKAYEAATEMYSVITKNSYSVNNLFPCLYTYALASHLAGETDSYNDVLSLLEYNGYTMSQQVISVINGDLTVEEILTDAEGDLA